MPTFIVKPDRNDDFYVAWSTIVDAPVGFGTREQMLQDPDVTPERIERADKNGTSACGDVSTWFDWNDHEFLIHNVKIKDWRDGAYFVPRSKLKELCHRVYADQDVSDLLRFEPHEPETSIPLGTPRGKGDK